MINMEDKPTSNEKDSPVSGSIAGLTGTLERVIERLREPPLLFALGVFIVLAIVAALSIDALTLLWIPALILAIIAMVLWLAPILIEKRTSRAGTRVRLRAEDVGETGTVKGIEGLPMGRGSDIELDMQAKHVKGRTVGISGRSEKDK
jgi:flagellar biosynthesis protein FliQ